MPSNRFPAGVCAASLTPLHDDGIAHDAFARHVEWLLAHGCDGCLLFGTTGEGLSFTVDERRAALDALLSNGIPADRLLVGSGALALPDATRLTQHATARGVGGVLVLPPFHYRDVREPGVVRFYDRLVQRVGSADLRLYFYHFPELSGVPISLDTIEHLRSAYPTQIAGIKDSSGDWDHTEALCRHFPGLQVFSGTERLLLPTLRADGAGCISATANVTAPLAARLLSAWQDGGSPDVLQERLTALRTAFTSLPTIPALKQVIARSHTIPEWKRTRPPLTSLSDEEETEVDALVSRLEGEVELPNTPT